MQAAQILSYGTPDVLTIRQVDQPSPAPGEVLVAVAATSINGHDTLVRAGALKIVSGRRFPIGLGLDFAGTIDGGAQQVWGTVAPRGKHVIAGAAEYVVVPADRVGPVPAGLTPVEAAALVVPGVTAARALRAAVQLQPGESVLVRGAAGGVGTAVVQLAHATGARVTALARARQATALTELGADDVLDYGTVTPDQLGTFDVIVDTVGTDLGAYRRRLNRGGRMVTVGLSGPAIAAIAASTVHGPRRIRTFSADPRTADLAELARLVEDGAIRPLIHRVFPFTEIAAAHAAFERGGVLGRQVVQIA